MLEPVPNTPFCKAMLLIPGTNTVPQEGGRERGTGYMPMGAVSLI